VHDALTGAAIAASLVPFGQAAILLIPAMDMMQVGESYDMIIAWTARESPTFSTSRIACAISAGRNHYLSIVRNGKRLQVTLPVTADTLQANTN